MRKISQHNRLRHSKRARTKHKKFVRRAAAKHRKIAGEIKFQNDVRLNAIAKGTHYRKPIKSHFQNKNRNTFNRPTIKFTNKITPPHFTLKYEHCIPVIEFINELKYMGQKGKHINIIMDDVVEIGEGAIAMLLSVINEIGNNAVFVKGTKPKDPSAKAILEKSGFFKYISTILSTENVNTKNAILRTGDNKTPNTEIAAEVRKSMETVWGINSRCPRLFGGIFEMFRNSCDHAFRKNESVTWHLGLSHFEENNLVKFSFVDNGKGIIKTFVTGLLKTVVNYFKDNTDILTTAFHDGIESRTGLSWRGKGLPTIFELSSDKIISNLVVITNNVYIDFDRNIIVTLPVSYSGTYYYWVIDKNCEQSNFI
jgi:hypothetical protein